MEDRRRLFLPEEVLFVEEEEFLELRFPNPPRVVVARTMAVVERVKRTPTAAPMAMCLLLSESESSMAGVNEGMLGGTD